MMNPDDHALAQRLVAVMDDATVTPEATVATPGEEKWEFAAVLVAAARRAGWNPRSAGD